MREAIRKSFWRQSPVVLVLYGVQVPPMLAGAFDVVAVRGEQRTIVGSLGLLQHEEKAEHSNAHAATLALDVSKAVEQLFAKEKPATLHVISSAHGGKAESSLKEREVRLKTLSS